MGKDLKISKHRFNRYGGQVDSRARKKYIDRLKLGTV